MLLADMGCDVIRVHHSGFDGSSVAPALYRGRTDLTLDLTSVADREKALALIGQADAVIEGFRAGVAEQLGIDPAKCLALNPRLVFARSSGWGREGPLAGTPGNDINHLALSGALHAIGTPPGPVPPLNLIGETAAGAMFLALGTIAAILSAQATGRGQVVEAAQVDSTATMMTFLYALHGAGRWLDLRQSNLLDGGAPFYRCYACADGRHVAVGALEPHAYRALCESLGLDAERYPQYERAAWGELASELSSIFATRTRDEWAEQLEGGDTCVTPVLSLAEAPLHPHNRARDIFAAVAGAMQPMPAPRFSATPCAIGERERASVEDVLARWS